MKSRLFATSVIVHGRLGSLKFLFWGHIKNSRADSKISIILSLNRHIIFECVGSQIENLRIIVKLCWKPTKTTSRCSPTRAYITKSILSADLCCTAEGALAPPWLDHLFPPVEGLCWPVCGRTELRGALRMDECRRNDRLAGMLRFLRFSLPFFPPPIVLLHSVRQMTFKRKKKYIGSVFTVYSDLSSAELLSQLWWQELRDEAA